MRKILGLTRYAAIVPALSCTIGTLLLMAQGSIAMLVAIYNTATNSTLLKSSIVEVLTAVDSILLGSVLLVIANGLDELFIDTDIDVRAWLR